MGYFLDAHDPAKWYMKGVYSAVNGKKRFKMFAFIPGTKRIKYAYNKGYDDANNSTIDIEYLKEKTTSDRFLEVLKNINSRGRYVDVVGELFEIALE